MFYESVIQFMVKDIMTVVGYTVNSNKMEGFSYKKWVWHIGQQSVIKKTML